MVQHARVLLEFKNIESSDGLKLSYPTTLECRNKIMKNLLNKIPTKISFFSKKEKGATMVEYALMVALIAVVSIATVGTLGSTVNTTFGAVDTAMTSAG
jgi:pilus assembly protein Flp/PilA